MAKKPVLARIDSKRMGTFCGTLLDLETAVNTLPQRFCTKDLWRRRSGPGPFKDLSWIFNRIICCHTRSAIDLDKVSALASAISAFSDTAVPLLGSALPAFRAARGACKNYAPGYGLNSIDLGHYMEEVEKNTSSPALRQRAADLRARLKELIVENYASAKRQGAFGSTGLGIYYPNSGSAHDKDPDREGYDAANNVFPVEFVQKEHWARFLREYWKVVA